MKIDLLLFAQLRDAFGTDRMTIEVEDGRCVADAAAEALATLGDRRLQELPLRFAVGTTFVDGDHALREGDVVALIPPVSGG